MNSEQTFAWGEEVRVASNAPANLRPAQHGSVCGVRKLGCSATYIYIVEFSDGTAIEIPQDLLERVHS